LNIDNNRYCVRCPQLLKNLACHKNEIISINSGEKLSNIVIQQSINDKPQLRSRQIFAWGDKSIIDNVGSKAITSSQLINPEPGLFALGGSRMDMNLFLVDEYNNGS
jgi:hypothetical protein